MHHDFDLDACFPLPARIPAQRNTLDLSPKTLEAWLRDLPVGHVETTARRLLQALQEVNRLDIEVNDRLRFIDAITGPVNRVLKTLHTALRNVAAPARPRELATAELAILLHQETVLAYRSALFCGETRRRFRKQVCADRAALIHHILYHLDRILIVHYLLKTQPHEGIWSRIYAMYLIAGEAESLALTHTLPGRSTAESIADTFKTITLLALSAPQALRGDEIHALCQLLPTLTRYVEPLPAGQGPADASALLIGLYSGAAPMVESAAKCHGGVHGSECLLLDATALSSELRRRITRLSKHPEKGDSGLVSQVRILSQLKSQLGPKHKRRSRRSGSSHEVEIVAGLQDVYQLLTGKNRPSPFAPVPPEPGKKTAAPGHTITYNVILNLEMVEIQSPRLPPRPPGDAPRLKEKVSHRHALCMACNISRGGYCLVAGNEGDFRLSVGELVTVRDSAQSRWLPGKVAWISSGKGRIQFGVALLAPFLAACKAIHHQDDIISSIECIALLEGPDAFPDRLLASPRTLSSGMRVSVELEDRMLELTVGPELEKTHGYVEFQCGFVHMEIGEPDTEPLFPEKASQVPGKASQNRFRTRTDDSDRDRPRDPSDVSDQDRPWKEFL